MKTYKIACIPGDGIGKEVIPAGQAVLETICRVRLDITRELPQFPAVRTNCLD
jgi:tartrate dehydrogenase/decarboxylase/D-malate dehydrogenase